ncbi:50S ribosomal protein L10 [Buchnera aphidicola]|uniref:50S ribosomal protein L10 n=1 Tax=Buchnera aphidicola TaxID=9 RepID=UPI0030EF0453
MALNIKKKKEIIKKINYLSNNSISAVIADSNKITSNEINKLRKKSRKSGVKITIVKNTLLKKAIKKTPIKCLLKIISGFTLIAHSMDHPGTAAKLLIKFSKKNKNFIIKGASFNKKFLSFKKIKKLAKIPTYLESIQKILFLLKDLSIGKLLRLICSLKNKKKLEKLKK